jgi:hypothetical protein
MSGYAQVSAEAKQRPDARKPARVVVLPPSAFSDEWPQKPVTDVAVGLRLVSESTLQSAKAEAARHAIGFYEGRELDCVDEDARVEAYNDALVRFVCARAMTDPNDIAAPYFPMAEDTIAQAMTTGGIMRVWDEYVRLLLGTGNRTTPIDDDDIVALAGALRPEVLRSLPRNVELEARKLLWHLHTILAPIAATVDAVNGAGEYVIRAAG